MDKDLAWKMFEKSGRVQDYLRYRADSNFFPVNHKKDDTYSEKFDITKLNRDDTSR